MFENPYGYSNYMIRKQFFKLFGETFRIYTPTGALAFYANLKAFKLKEDIRVYSDESRTREILAIKARNIIDIAATYDVIDSMSGQKIGAFKRKGLKSIIKDEWLIFDAQDQQIGMIQEDSWKLALLRRYITNLIPQKFHGTVNGQPVFIFQQHFNPIIQKIDLDYSIDTNGLLDRRLGIAAAVLMCGIEGRQG